MGGGHRVSRVRGSLAVFSAVPAILLATLFRYVNGNNFLFVYWILFFNYRL